MSLKLFILFTLFLSFGVLARDSVEQQEARLARAELAMARGNENEALSLILQNLDRFSFHNASFQFVLDYHLKNRKYSRALRVLHYIISKLHDKRVLQARYDDNFNNFLSSLSLPNKDALAIYFSIGELYYSLYQKQIYNSSFNNRLLTLAEKYFRIAEYFRYEVGLTKIYIGRVHSERENYRDALNEFITAKEIYQEDLQTTSERGFEEINLLIGTTMIQGGLFDPGTLYLRSIFFNTDANNSSRVIAQEYLDAINYQYFSLSVKYDYIISDNIYELNDFQLSEYASFEQFLGPKDGTSKQISLSAYYNQPTFFKNINSLFIASFSQQTYDEELHQNRNERSISLGFDAKFTQIENALPKLRYFYTKSLNPPDNSDNYQSTATTHTIEPSYIKSLKSGSLNYSIPIYKTLFETGAEEQSVGLSIAYTPYWLRKLFSPSFSIGYFSRKEVSLDESGSRIDLTTSIQSEWAPKFSTFTNILVRKNSNNNAFFDYTEYNLTLVGSYVWNWGISFNAEANYRNRVNTDDSKTSVLRSTLSASFTY